MCIYIYIELHQKPYIQFKLLEHHQGCCLQNGFLASWGLIRVNSIELSTEMSV